MSSLHSNISTVHVSALGEGNSGLYSNRKKQPNRVRLSEVGGGAEVLTYRGGGGSQAGSTGSLLIVLGVGTRRGEVGLVQEGTGTAVAAFPSPHSPWPVHLKSM